MTIHGESREILEPYNPDDDPMPLTAEQRLLAINYVPMARQIVRRQGATWPGHPSELQSTAYKALIEAARTFDPSRKVGFGTYARHRIRGAVRDFQRLMDSGSSLVNAQRPLLHKLRKTQQHNGPGIGGQPETCGGQAIESTLAVESWLSGLPKAHAAACRLIYVNGRSPEEAATEVGCSKSFLARLNREAITWLISDYHQVRKLRGDSSQPIA